MADKSLWIYEENPPEIGWYPTVLCWDNDEGVFPDSHIWDGEKWTGSSAYAVIGFYPVLCKNKDEARDLAYENDPEL